MLGVMLLKLAQFTPSEGERETHISFDLSEITEMKERANIKRKDKYIKIYFKRPLSLTHSLIKKIFSCIYSCYF